MKRDMAVIDEVHGMSLSENEIQACAGRALKGMMHSYIEWANSERERGVLLHTRLFATAQCFAVLLSGSYLDDIDLADGEIMTSEMVHAVERVMLQMLAERRKEAAQKKRRKR